MAVPYYQVLVVIEFNGQVATTSMGFNNERDAETAIEQVTTKKPDSRWPTITVRRAYVPSWELPNN